MVQIEAPACSRFHTAGLLSSTNGAGGRNRTDTTVKSLDFESHFAMFRHDALAFYLVDLKSFFKSWVSSDV